ncbi:MAG: hypothetical protein CMK43_01415 [Porticoccaceae bacterium]|nr:hypothetical protein [Porticoccaceae bacterium]
MIKYRTEPPIRFQQSIDVPLIPLITFASFSNFSKYVVRLLRIQNIFTVELAFFQRVFRISNSINWALHNGPQKESFFASKIAGNVSLKSEEKTSDKKYNA